MIMASERLRLQHLSRRNLRRSADRRSERPADSRPGRRSWSSVSQRDAIDLVVVGRLRNGDRILEHPPRLVGEPEFEARLEQQRGEDRDQHGRHGGNDREQGDQAGVELAAVPRPPAPPAPWRAGATAAPSARWRASDWRSAAARSAAAIAASRARPTLISIGTLSDQDAASRMARANRRPAVEASAGAFPRAASPASPQARSASRNSADWASIKQPP